MRPGAGLRRTLRVAGAGLLLATTAIHLDLYLTGYRTIPTIGWLFLLQIIAGFGLGLLILATGNRLLAAAGAGFALATLGGYLISVQFGLFGFREVRTTAGIAAALLEVAAFAVLAALAALPGRAAMARAARAADPDGTGGSGGRQLTGPYVRRRTPASPPDNVLPGDTAGRTPSARPGARITRLAGPAVVAVSVLALVLLAGALSGAGSKATTPGTAGTALQARTINGARVLTDAQGRTLYSFAPDTARTSACYGSCAQYWPPVAGPDHAGTGVTGTLGTITRNGGSMQETYDGHPLYTYVGDTSPGQANGNNLNLNGGLWHEVLVSP
jgi:predicted lipoprotein with Yx(FWY)xxD motif